MPTALSRVESGGLIDWSTCEDAFSGNSNE